MLYLVCYMNAYLATIKREEEGQGMAEYALIIALVAILLITSLTGLKTGIANVFTRIVAGFTAGA
jgi:pilus assembly protein Flp/PilA